jgi:16S rRNA (uracil1498-N3)-methyltransferase
MHRSYVEPAWIQAWLKDPKYAVPQEVSRRFIEIVRIKAHEKVGLFDGRGYQLEGLLVFDHNKKSYFLSDTQIKHVSLPTPQIILAQAACVESKITETLRRGCEFGVDQFVIFNAQKSEAFCFNKLKKRHERLEAVILDAARQSERLIIPTLRFCDNYQEFLGPQGIFGDLKAEIRLSQALKENFDPQADFLIIIGPEGGLSASEIAYLREAKLSGVRFGPYTQRTELAGLAAVAIINAFCGRA